MDSSNEVPDDINPPSTENENFTVAADKPKLIEEDTPMDNDKTPKVAPQQASNGPSSLPKLNIGNLHDDKSTAEQPTQNGSQNTETEVSNAIEKDIWSMEPTNNNLEDDVSEPKQDDDQITNNKLPCTTEPDVSMTDEDASDLARTDHLIPAVTKSPTPHGEFSSDAQHASATAAVNEEMDIQYTARIGQENHLPVRPGMQPSAAYKHPHVSNQGDEDSTRNNAAADKPPLGNMPAPGIALDRAYFERWRNMGQGEEQTKKPRQTQAEKERKLAEGLDSIRAGGNKCREVLFDRSKSPTSEPSVPPSSSRGSIAPEFVTIVDEEDPAFTKLRLERERKIRTGETISLQDEVIWSKARDAEKHRRYQVKRQIEADKEHDDRDFQQAKKDDQLFLNDDEDDGGDFEELGPLRHRRNTPSLAGISRRLMQETAKVGIQDFQEQKAAKSKSRGKQSKNLGAKRKNASQGDGANKLPKKAGNGTTNNPPKRKGSKKAMSSAGAGVINDLESLGSSSTMRGRAPPARPVDGRSGDGPKIMSTKTKEALANMLKDIPTEDVRTATLDTKDVHDAIKSLEHPRRMKSDVENNGWKLKGMKFALENFQVIGLGRMRRIEQRSTEPRGGIIADEMGLGKTVSMIANIIDGKAEENDTVRSTLIVVPSALTKQWMEEIKKHVETDTFRNIFIYGKRFDSTVASVVRTLQLSDVVITTYHELRDSWPNGKPPPHLPDGEQEVWIKSHIAEKRGPLHRVMWKRVVLDECQQVKNAVAQTALAACGLSAHHRWLMSGTIVTNDISEFYSFFKFLKIPYLGGRSLFTQNFLADPKAQDRLCQVLKSIMIRRTHKDQFLGSPLLDLPASDQSTIAVTFTAFERAMYDIVYRACRRNVWRYMKSKGTEIYEVFLHVLQTILLLRQLTGHLFNCVDSLGKFLEPSDMEKLYQLCDEMESSQTDDVVSKVRVMFQRMEPEVEEESKVRAELLPKEFNDHYKENGFLRAYRKKKGNGKAEDPLDYVCEVCKEPPVKIWRAECQHIFCEGCLENLKEQAKENDQEVEACPVYTCQASLQVEKFTKSALKKLEARKFWDPAKFFPSSKTHKVEVTIKRWLSEDPHTKVIIFSCFLEMIEVLGVFCNLNKWDYCQYTGKMTMNARNASLELFKNDSKKKILLMSLKAGGVGLNIIEASKVILFDLGWNDATEQQAFARVHRFGQTKPTQFFRLAVQDSIDQRILDLQEKKLTRMKRVLNGEGHSKDGVSEKELIELFDLESYGENGQPNGFMLPNEGVDELVNDE